jgi:hypothetical protein
MDEVVLQPDHVPEQLRISGNDLSGLEGPLIVGDFIHAFHDDPRPNRILNAILDRDSLEEINGMEYTEQDEYVL